MWLEPTVTSNTIEQMNSRMPYNVHTNHNMQLTLIQGCCKLSWIVILFLCGEREKKRKFCDQRSKQLSLFLCQWGLPGTYSRKNAVWGLLHGRELKMSVFMWLFHCACRTDWADTKDPACIFWGVSHGVLPLARRKLPGSHKRGHVRTLV